MLCLSYCCRHKRSAGFRALLENQFIPPRTLKTGLAISVINVQIRSRVAVSTAPPWLKKSAFSFNLSEKRTNALDRRMCQWRFVAKHSPAPLCPQLLKSPAQSLILGPGKIEPLHFITDLRWHLAVSWYLQVLWFGRKQSGFVNEQRHLVVVLGSWRLKNVFFSDQTSRHLKLEKNDVVLFLFFGQKAENNLK